MSWLVDASVFLAAYLKDEAQHESARDFLLRAADLWVCSITPVEVVDALAGVVRRGRLGAADALAAERGIRGLGRPVVAVDDQVPAALEASLDGLGHPYDLIQVLTARAHGLQWVSLDERQGRLVAETPLADSLCSVEQAVAGLI